MAVLSERQHSLLTALLPVLVVMALFPLADLVISAIPMRMDEPRWRFAAAGMLIGATPQISLALVLMLGIAALQEHRMISRIAGITAILFAVLLGGTILLFGLDALEVRRLVPENAKQNFDNASLKSIVMVVLYGPVLLWLGWRGLVAAKRQPGETKKTGDGGSPLMVGQ
jgi:hypothetical protein